MECSVDEIKYEKVIIKTGKEWLVDVPVCILIWIRPEFQDMQFEVIAKARPSILFVVSDGGRTQEEWEVIKKNRTIIDRIDWNCKVYKVFFAQNEGMYGSWKKKNKIIWNEVDRCIFLEDDLVPSVSYFSFCKEMLDKYENDLRVAAICGYNYANDCSKDIDEDYFFASKVAIWSVAYWKRTACFFNEPKSYMKSNNTAKNLKENIKSNHYNHIFWLHAKGFATEGIYEGHIAGSEFNLGLSACANNQVFIYPTRNMISNVGVGANSTHSAEINLLPKRIQRLFCSQTFELEGSIRHPQYMIPFSKFDKEFDSALMAKNSMQHLKRKIIRLIRTMIYGDWKTIVNKMKVHNEK